MNQAQFIKLLLVSIGFLVGIGVGNMGFFRTSISPSLVISTNPDSIKKEVAVNDAVYRKDINALNVKDSILTQQKQSTNVALRQKKVKHSHLIQKVNAELDEYKTPSDSAFNSTLPEEIKISIAELLSSDFEKDSLYMQMVDVLEQQVEVKDSVIIVQENQHQYLKNKFNESLSNQKVLFDNNLLYQEEIKRHKKKNRFLSAAVLLLGGIAAASLLHH